MLCPSCRAENDPASEVCFTCGKVLSALTKGSRIAGRYEVLTVLGKGGMGMVYKAFDRMLEEEVAIKVLRKDVMGDPESARRFRAEIKLARKVTHPNVCRIHEYGEDGDLSYFSMALLEGTDLYRMMLARPAGAQPEEAFDVAIQACAGLQAIHDTGIIHRDLKSANIMRDTEGTVRLMDFGIAREARRGGGAPLTAAGTLVGTAEYMSPEQCRGSELDARSDVYALGVVIYELFTGKLPFQGESLVATLFLHIRQPPPLSGPLASRLPPPLIPVLEKALAKEADERYASARELAVALEAARSETEALPPREAEARQPIPVPPSGPTVPIPPSRSTERRSESRLTIPINVKLRWGGARDAPPQEEQSIIDSISRHGARVMTAMAAISPGDELTLEEIDGGFTARAVVRNAYHGSDNIRRLGLQFLDQTAPDRLLPPREDRERRAATPAARPTVTPSRPKTERRASSRLETPLEVMVARVRGPEVLPDERTLAENISRGGARVMTADPSISASDVVRFREVGGDFQTQAEVRHAYAGRDRIRRLNLKFLDRPAPDRLAQTDDMRASGRFRAVAGPADTRSDRRRALSRTEIQETYLGLRQRDHFALLGVPRDAETEMIKAAYAELAERYSADAQRDPKLSGLFKEIGAVRHKLGKAHEVLSDPSRRADYERSLGREPDGERPAAASAARAKAERHEPPSEDVAATRAPAGRPSSATPATQTDVERLAELEKTISEGQRLLGEAKYWDAIQMLEGAVRLAKGTRRLRHKAQVLLARGLSQNPKWRRRAELLLDGVIEEDPASVPAHLELAALYKGEGLDRKATRLFLRVMELEPDNEIAQAELAPSGRAGWGQRLDRD